MNLLAAAGASGSPVRKVVLKSSGLVYGAATGRSLLLPRGHDAHAARRARTSSARCSKSKRSCATSPTTTRTSTSRCCASPTCSATTSTRRSRSRCAGRSCPRSSASIRACSSCTKTTSSARSCTRPPTTSPASTTSPATATCRGARCARSSASARVPLPPWLTNLAAEPLRLLRLVGPAARGAAAAALRPLARQRPLQAGRLPLPVHERGHGRGVRAGPAPREDRSATSTRRTATSARSKTSSATPPPCPARLTEPTDGARPTSNAATRVAVVTLVDLERRNAMTAHDGRRDRRDVRRARSRRRPSARSSSPASRRRSARAPTSPRSARSSEQRERRRAATVTSIYEGFLRVLRSPLPTVAAVNGPAVGAG